MASRSGSQGRYEPVDAEIKAMLAYARTRPYGFYWQEEGFSDDRGIQVQFRQLGQDENEHWLNHAAVALTRWPGDQPPFGNNCHCEIVMEPQKGRLVRCATMCAPGLPASRRFRRCPSPLTRVLNYRARNLRALRGHRSHARHLSHSRSCSYPTLLRLRRYKYCEKDPANPDKVEWKPGKVFIADISDGDFKKYTGFHIPATRTQQLRLWCFFLLRMGTPFNNTSYYLKAFSPWSIGCPTYVAGEHDVAKAGANPDYTFYCTQLVILALQAAAHEVLRLHPELVDRQDYWAPTVMRLRACDYTPNSLFRLLSTMKDASRTFEPNAMLSLD